MSEKNAAEELAILDQEELSARINRLFDPKKIPTKSVSKSQEQMIEDAKAVIALTRDHIGFKILDVEIAKRYEYLQAQLMSVESMEKVSEIRAQIKGIMSIRELVRNIVMSGQNAAIAIRKKEIEDEEPKPF